MEEEFKSKNIIKHFEEVFNKVREIQKKCLDNNEPAPSVIISVTDEEATSQMVNASTYGIRMAIMHIMDQLPLKDKMLIGIAINAYLQGKIEESKNRKLDGDNDIPMFVANPSKSVN